MKPLVLVNITCKKTLNLIKLFTLFNF